MPSSWFFPEINRTHNQLDAPSCPCAICSNSQNTLQCFPTMYDPAFAPVEPVLVPVDLGFVGLFAEMMGMIAWALKANQKVIITCIIAKKCVSNIRHRIIGF